MRFYVKNWRGSRSKIEPEGAEPHIILTKNSWNDYGYKTTYDISYFINENEVFYIKAGIKILQLDEEETKLPDEFENLESQFYSLGQSLDYYEQLLKLDSSIYSDILVGLRDVVFNESPIEINRVKSDDGFQISLLRFSEAEKAFKEASSLFPELHKINIEKERFKFSFSCQVEGAENEHSIECDFSQDDLELFRLLAIIGKNGTGKTQFLANFAKAMSGLEIKSGAFQPSRPPFSKVISISYSVFDEFSRPYDETEEKISNLIQDISKDEAYLKTSQDYLEKLMLYLNNFQNFEQKLIDMYSETNHDKKLEIGLFVNEVQTEIEKKQNEVLKLEKKLRANRQSLGIFEESRNLFSYVYCGIRKHKQLLTQEEIWGKLSKAYKLIQESKRVENWIEIIKALLSDTTDKIETQGIRKNGINKKFYKGLSSGQRILVLVFTEVIAYIEKESIILFDEPELHLHPEAISAVARAFHILLDKFQSYAIIATHSPIILQEIPSKYVRIFRRHDNYVFVDPLSNESFGENITSIIDQVFETIGKNNNYKYHFRDLLQQYSTSEILDMFDGNLGFNARAALGALDSSRK